MEMENIQKMITIVNNRMYGDYYKLYNIIITQMNDLLPITVQNQYEPAKKYPAYKDLEPMHEYKIVDMVDIHKEILSLINSLFSYYTSKEQNINEYMGNANMGLSISNFIHTLEYENTLLKEQISLYTGYVSFFHVSQRGYLSKLHIKLISFQNEIEQDIRMNSKNDNILDNCGASSDKIPPPINDNVEIDFKQLFPENMVVVDVLPTEQSDVKKVEEVVVDLLSMVEPVLEEQNEISAEIQEEETNLTE
jgi:hypothetical protein